MENVQETSASSQAPKWPQGLIKKLATVLQAVDYVEKLGVNQKQGWKYQRASDIARAVRREMAKQNILLVPKSWDRNTESVTTMGGGQARIEHLMGHFQFIDGDTGEVLDVMVPSSGFDTGDKGIFKAITGALKYVLKTVFLVPEEGDDPEDEKPDHAEGVSAAKAVAEKKLSDYAQKSAAQVKGKTLEYYPHKFGDVDAVVFLPSESLSVMLENGLKDIAQYSDTVKARWIVDDPEPLAILEKIAGQLDITCKRVFPPSQAAPTAKYQAPPSRPDSFPILHKAEVMKGRKGPYLAVVWGETKASCFKQHLWEALQAGASAKQQANLKTEMNGAYTNIVDIYQIGEREYLEGAPLRRTDDVGPMKFF